MAGPGATIRVDGFRGGRLPPKSQIRSIRFSRDMFAAENHGGGMVFVDIVTQPGLGPLRGGLDFTFRDDSLNARNAFVDEKGPEQTQQFTFNLSGTLVKERTSFSLSAGGASLYDSANVFAALPGGSRSVPIRRPSDRMNVNGRIDHALTKTQTLRVTFQQNQNEQRALGVGNFDLSERAYRRTSDDSVFRLSESGRGPERVRRVAVSAPLAFNRAVSASELPTVRVLDAFTAGGAPEAADATAPRSSGRPTSTGRRGNTRCAPACSSKEARTAATAGHYLGTYTSRAWPTTSQDGRPPTRSERETRSSSTRSGRLGSSCRTTGGPQERDPQWRVAAGAANALDDRWNLARAPPSPGRHSVTAKPRCAEVVESSTTGSTRTRSSRRFGLTA